MILSCFFFRLFPTAVSSHGHEAEAIFFVLIVLPWSSVRGVMSSVGVRWLEDRRLFCLFKVPRHGMRFSLLKMFFSPSTIFFSERYGSHFHCLKCIVFFLIMFSLSLSLSLSYVGHPGDLCNSGVAVVEVCWSLPDLHKSLNPWQETGLGIEICRIDPRQQLLVIAISSLATFASSTFAPR